MLKVHFLGAAETVTGSKYLIETFKNQVLVDCGLFQGVKKLRKLNWENPPFDAEKISHVLLTHGHLDHVGFLPRLLKMGFKGKIFGTAPTLKIAKIILEDSAKIQEEEAEEANKSGYSRHKPARPLYNLKDVEKTVNRFEEQPLNEWIHLHKRFRYRHRYAGHIPGATFLELQVEGKKIIFSGDLGRISDPLLFPPERPENTDVLIVESTYGSRLHLEENAMETLKLEVEKVIKNKGILLIPSFAVERAQLLMYYLWQLKKKSLIPDIPIYLDSPMGASVTSLLLEFEEWHKLNAEDCREMFRHIKITSSFKETISIIENPHPKIVIAGSGMVNGGRILTYLTYFIHKENTTVLLAGFQAEGTRGRQLLEGAEEVKIFGKYYPVKAAIRIIRGLSAHADQEELLQWIGNLKELPSKIFLTHGEPHEADALRVKIHDIYGMESVIPALNEVISLDE